MLSQLKVGNYFSWRGPVLSFEFSEGNFQVKANLERHDQFYGLERVQELGFIELQIEISPNLFCTRSGDENGQDLVLKMGVRSYPDAF